MIANPNFATLISTQFPSSTIHTISHPSQCVSLCLAKKVVKIERDETRISVSDTLLRSAKQGRLRHRESCTVRVELLIEFCKWAIATVPSRNPCAATFPGHLYQGCRHLKSIVDAGPSAPDYTDFPVLLLCRRRRSGEETTKPLHAKPFQCKSIRTAAFSTHPSARRRKLGRGSSSPLSRRRKAIVFTKEQRCCCAKETRSSAIV
ncbi:hypothetical protein Droror1_Dr00024171 [Drosera rotundifolia]